MLIIDYNNVKVSDYLRLLAHYTLPNKKQRRLIENRFICLNALIKKRKVNLMGIESLVLSEDVELAKSLRNKKENYIKNQFLLTRIARQKNTEGKTKEFYQACKEYEEWGEKAKEFNEQLAKLFFKKEERDRVEMVANRMREVDIPDHIIEYVLNE
ncbi:hypothetical protein SAMN04488156_10194 [Bacillus sp. 166amftsu]|nr:hypothetical protein SAMN04488156_10194 [Bacillus sp. 166amftsu]